MYEGRARPVVLKTPHLSPVRLEIRRELNNANETDMVALDAECSKKNR